MDNRASKQNKKHIVQYLIFAVIWGWYKVRRRMYEIIKENIDEIEKIERILKKMKKIYDEYETCDTNKLLEQIDNDKELVDAIKQYLTRVIQYDIYAIKEYVNLYENFVIQIPLDKLVEDTMDSLQARKQIIQIQLSDLFREYGYDLLKDFISAIDFYARNTTNPCEVYTKYSKKSLYKALQDFTIDNSLYNYIKEDIKIIEKMPKKIYMELDEKYRKHIMSKINDYCKGGDKQ